MSAQIIWFEGSDYVGKTTQISKLSDYLVKQGKQVLITREPGSTPLMQGVRSMLLNKSTEKLSYLTRRLLYAADHAQLLSYLSNNKDKYDYIIVDRYTLFSDLVYGPMSIDSDDFESAAYISDNINRCYEAFYEMQGYCAPEDAHLLVLHISNNTLKDRNDKRMTTPGYVKDVFDEQNFDAKVKINGVYNMMASMIQSELHKEVKSLLTPVVKNFKDVYAIDADGTEEQVFLSIKKVLGV